MFHLFKVHLGEQNRYYLRPWKITTKKGSDKSMYLPVSSLVQSRGLNKALLSSWYSTSEKAQQCETVACFWTYKHSILFKHSIVLLKLEMQCGAEGHGAMHDESLILAWQWHSKTLEGDQLCWGWYHSSFSVLELYPFFLMHKRWGSGHGREREVDPPKFSGFELFVLCLSLTHCSYPTLNGSIP